MAAATAKPEPDPNALPIWSNKLKKPETYRSRRMAPEPVSLIPRPADIDMDIIREMYHSRAVTIAGMDPRLNATRIAERLGVSRARVDARMKEWTRHGLLRRFDVWPNPALFDRIGATVDVRVRDRFEKEDVLSRVRLIDGAVGGGDFVGEWITVQFIVPREADAQRTAKLLRELSGVAEVSPPVPWIRLEPKRPLSALDLRIIRVLRKYPTERLSTIARHVGISTRTMTTRYGRLVEDLEVWFVPVLDFRALAQPVLAVNLGLREGADPTLLSHAVRKNFPQSLEFLRAPFGPALPERTRVYFLLIPSTARVEDAERTLRSLPGVETSEALLMIRMFSFPEAFDRLLAEERRR